MAENAATLDLSKKTKALLKKLTNAGLTAELHEEILKRWGRQAAIIAGQASRYAGERKKVRSGALRRSIVGVSELYKGVPATRVGILRGPAVRYAGVQEHGTKKYNPSSPYNTITPKKAKALAFAPEGSPAVLPSGVARYSSPREYPGELEFVPFKGGNVIGGLYDKEDLEAVNSIGTSLKDFQAVYILIRRMDVKPGYFLRDSMKEGIPKLLQIAAEVISQILADRPSA